jgi:hypothetical protein
MSGPDICSAMNVAIARAYNEDGHGPRIYGDTF